MLELFQDDPADRGDRDDRRDRRHGRGRSRRVRPENVTKPVVSFIAGRRPRPAAHGPRRRDWKPPSRSSNPTPSPPRPPARSSAASRKRASASADCGRPLCPRAEAEGFYAVHQERPFFNDLCSFMTSGPAVVMALEAEGAIQKWRDVIGATDSTKAAEGDDPQPPRHRYRAQRRAWLRRPRDGRRRGRLLVPRARTDLRFEMGPCPKTGFRGHLSQSTKQPAEGIGPSRLEVSPKPRFGTRSHLERPARIWDGRLC